MKNGQVQIQEQVERLRLKLTPQQIVTARVLELPILELEQKVKDELAGNEGLDEGHENEDDFCCGTEDDYGEEGRESEEVHEDTHRDDTYDDDDIPVHTGSKGGTDYEIPIGDTTSFIDLLVAQIHDFDVTERQAELLEYLINTLNDDGYIDRSLAKISDDLLFNFDIDASVQELESVLEILHKFDPAGIGARNLQECLLIQIERLLSEDTIPEKKLRHQLEREIITNHFELFQRNKADQIAEALNESPNRVEAAIAGIKRLNPRPGLSLCESVDGGAQTIVPDFIIETSPEGDITIELNNGEVPELRVSREYAEMLKMYEKRQGKLNRSEQATYSYIKPKVENARTFIDAIKQRQHTLYVTMKAIVKLQKDFILSQDEADLHPMRLKDVADLTKLDISTISRVRNSKYVQIDGHTFSLDYFFLRARTNADGEALEHKEIKQKIKEIIDSEDKKKPYSDQQIVGMLQAENMNISRRTVAKYRTEKNIPATSERKEL